MNEFIKKLSSSYEIEIVELSYKKRGVNSYKLDLNGNVTQLHLYQVPLGEVDKLRPVADSLVALTLFECDIEDLEQIRSFKQLEELDLTLNTIPELSGLETLINLKKLKLSCVYMDSLRELRHLKQLEVLDLSSNIELSFDNELEELDKLIELNLEGNDLYDIGIIGGIKSLVKLNLKECEISEIKNLDQFLNLEELNLSGNSIEEIKGLEKLTRLKELRLNSTKIERITGLETLVKLESLDLSDTRITKIENLKELNSLMNLNLSYLGIKQIEGLESLKNLELLMLISNNISILENLPSDNLRTLEAASNEIKDVDPNWLKSIQQPCTINLTNNPVKLEEQSIPEHVTIEMNNSTGAPLIL